MFWKFVFFWKKAINNYDPSPFFWSTRTLEEQKQVRAWWLQFLFKNTQREFFSRDVYLLHVCNRNKVTQKFTRTVRDARTNARALEPNPKCGNKGDFFSCTFRVWRKRRKKFNILPGTEIGVAELRPRRRSDRLNRTSTNLNLGSTATDENHQKILLLLLLPLIPNFYN